jgi:hypothetical protein
MSRSTTAILALAFPIAVGGHNHCFRRAVGKPPFCDATIFARQHRGRPMLTQATSQRIGSVVKSSTGSERPMP